MKTWFFCLSAVFIAFSILHMIFGTTNNALWFAVVANFWLVLSDKK